MERRPPIPTDPQPIDQVKIYTGDPRLPGLALLGVIASMVLVYAFHVFSQ